MEFPDVYPLPNYIHSNQMYTEDLEDLLILQIFSYLKYLLHMDPAQSCLLPDMHIHNSWH